MGLPKDLLCIVCAYWLGFRWSQQVHLWDHKPVKCEVKQRTSFVTSEDRLQKILDWVADVKHHAFVKVQVGIQCLLNAVWCDSQVPFQIFEQTRIA